MYMYINNNYNKDGIHVPYLHHCVGLCVESPAPGSYRNPRAARYDQRPYIRETMHSALNL